MKTSDLRPCDKCAGPIGPMFYELTLVRHVMDYDAVQEQAGLALMLGGNLDLAGVMGPDRDATHEIGRDTLILCQACGIDLHAMADEYAPRDEEATK